MELGVWFWLCGWPMAGFDARAPSAASGLFIAPAAAYGLAAEADMEFESTEDMGGGTGADGFNAANGLAAAGTDGAAGAVVFCLAISASAFKILEVSGAPEAPLAGTDCGGGPPRAFEPGAGDPSGVVDSTSNSSQVRKQFKRYSETITFWAHEAYFERERSASPETRRAWVQGMCSHAPKCRSVF